MYTFEFTKEEVKVLLMALRCYDLEIDHEDDDNHPVFMALRKKIRWDLIK